MTDLEQRARKALVKIIAWRNCVMGGYEPEGEGAVEIITQALADVREEAVQVIQHWEFNDAEDEDGIIAAIRRGVQP